MLPQFMLSVRSSLGQLNKNITRMGKTLTKVAGGLKRNSVADGASEVAISEKMRQQIRSLGQDQQNVQNGAAMIKTASGGVEDIVDVLREMKKKAIDAANDSNTDEDRATIQKEINQLRSTINDVAIDTQFNGKRLLNGLYGLTTTVTKERDGYIEPPKEYTLYAGETYKKTVEADGSRKIVGKIIGVNKVKNLMGGFKTSDPYIQRASSLQSGGYLQTYRADFGYDGKYSQWNWAQDYAEKNFTQTGETKVYFENTNTGPSTAQQVIRALMHSFDQTNLSGVAAFDEAINYCTGSEIKTKDELVEQFMNHLNNSATYEDFLRDYCDIDLTNTDTGAITGSDAGGGSTKTAESVVPESSSPSSWTAPVGSSTSIYSHGLTVNWPTTGVLGAPLTAEERHIMAGLNSEWIKQSLDLIQDTYGIDFRTKGAFIKEINVQFKDSDKEPPSKIDPDALAYVQLVPPKANNEPFTLNLIVNMHHYNSIDTTSEDGKASGTSGYLDRIIAHEFTHAVMDANVYSIAEMPVYIMEGMAELTHGIDDLRATTIRNLLNNKSHLQDILSTCISVEEQNKGNDIAVKDENYAAGYMLLRYLAKNGKGKEISSVEPVYAEEYSSQQSRPPSYYPNLLNPPEGLETGVEINFGSSSNADGSKLRFPTDFDDQGFCILCGKCEQYINITFDKDLPIGTSKLESTLITYTERKDYTIGIGGAKSTDDLAKALFEGIKNAPGRDTAYDIYVVDANGKKSDEPACIYVDRNHNLRIAKNPAYPDDSSSEYIFLKDYSPSILFKEGGIIDATGSEGSKDDAPDGTALQMLDDEGNEILDENDDPIPYEQEFTLDKDTTLHIWEPRYKNVSSSSGNSLVIHSGTQANQHGFYYIGDMQTKSLTTGKLFDADNDWEKDEQTLINERDRARYQSLSNDPAKQEAWLETLKAAENMSIDDISVATVRDANIAIRVLDGALEYALDNATTLGAYLQRLEYTESNIVTTEENTIASESTIRDADMAKEMTEYTKANLLMQSSQAMLSQANQNVSGILDLLK